MNCIDLLLGYLLTFQSYSLVCAQDLAAQFEVSERIVYRDVDALCEVGVPIVGVAGEGYRLLEGTTHCFVARVLCRQHIPTFLKPLW